MSYVSHIVLRGPDARVHWWYWPDSYDSWIPVDQAPDADDPDKPSRGKVPHPLPLHTCSVHVASVPGYNFRVPASLICCVYVCRS